jgi:hypothetical protein
VVGAVRLRLEPAPGAVLFAADVVQAAVPPRVLGLPGLGAVRRGAAVRLAVFVRVVLFPVRAVLPAREEKRPVAVRVLVPVVCPPGEAVGHAARVPVVAAETLVRPLGLLAALLAAEVVGLAVFPPGLEVSGLVTGGRLAVVVGTEVGGISPLGLQRCVCATVVVALVSLAAAPSGLAVGARLVAAGNGAAVVGAEDGARLAVSIGLAAGYLAGVVATVVAARLPVSSGLVAAGNVAPVMRAVGRIYLGVVGVAAAKAGHAVSSSASVVLAVG